MGEDNFLSTFKKKRIAERNAERKQENTLSDLKSAKKASSKPKLEHAPVQPSTLPTEKFDSYLDQLRKCTAPHVSSYDFFATNGLHLMSQEFEPVFVRGPKNIRGESALIALKIHSLSLQKPKVDLSGSNRGKGLVRPVYPNQCRLARATYQGELFAAFSIVINNKETIEMPSQRIGRIPVMVGSSACQLRDKTRDQLIQLGEEQFEGGGQFIVNGAEKTLRLIVAPRCNHPISARRGKNEARGPFFTDLSVEYRSMRRDLTTVTLHFHLLRSMGVNARITIENNEYFVPVGVLLRALLPSGTSDREIYDLIIGGDSDYVELCNSGIAIIKDLSARSKHFKKKESEPGVNPAVSRLAAISYLGKNFRGAIGLNDTDISNLQAGVAFFRRFIFVHLSVGPFDREDDCLDRSKADLLVLVIRKLVGTSTGDIEIDDQDALSHHSAVTPGHLLQLVLKDRIATGMQIAAALIRREGVKDKHGNKAEGPALHALVKTSITKMIQGDLISKHVGYLLSTGNLPANSRLDLSSVAGYSVLAERINMFRYLCHFRAIHRGSFYAEMRSTKVRKLLPEAWGFVCPVHTPDGAPCGILNHLASETVISQNVPSDRQEIIDLFSDFNVMPAPALSASGTSYPKDNIPLVVDGRIIGFVHKNAAEDLADQIRYTKIRDSVEVLSNLAEVVLVNPIDAKGGFMPGLFVHTVPGRLMRPVKWLKSTVRKASKGQDKGGQKEWIGSLEQVFMRVRPANSSQKDTLSPISFKGATHAEISPLSFLSVLSLLSPFPEMNQGPRNMFQCQMAKQTMGTPAHTIWTRTDAKVYRHNTPQVPITRNFCMQDPLGADLFPNGVNAVVAVISYSGNDMEDALILNKGSIDRGFAHGTVYINEHIDLDLSIAGREEVFVSDIHTKATAADQVDAIDADGLPQVGVRIESGSKIYGQCTKHQTGGLKGVRYGKHKLIEEGAIDGVMVYDSDMYKGEKQLRGEGIRQATVRRRILRRPSVGDKFASRAGQKGTMSCAWPTEDMPFTESGMTPDILFNPNGFPSRMTIGMMVEVMSGKAGACHGRFNDSTPFQFDERNTAVDYFADQLTKAGYEYNGNETLYSGYTGEPFEVSIFTGIVHYQRLRHMVSDKFQVRTTGTVHPLFRQPIKGRKKGGAIRFGEMERDGLLAHGASFLLRDRLLMASDVHLLHVCEVCGSILTPVRQKEDSVITCLNCEKEERKGCVQKVVLPYSFKYLANELAAMNIRTIVNVKEVV